MHFGGWGGGGGGREGEEEVKWSVLYSTLFLFFIRLSRVRFRLIPLFRYR